MIFQTTVIATPLVIDGLYSSSARIVRGTLEIWLKHQARKNDSRYPPGPTITANRIVLGSTYCMKIASRVRRFT